MFLPEEEHRFTRGRIANDVSEPRNSRPSFIHEFGERFAAQQSNPSRLNVSLVNTCKLNGLRLCRAKKKLDCRRETARLCLSFENFL